MFSLLEKANFNCRVSSVWDKFKFYSPCFLVDSCPFFHHERAPEKRVVWIYLSGMFQFNSAQSHFFSFSVVQDYKTLVLAFFHWTANLIDAKTCTDNLWWSPCNCLQQTKCSCLELNFKPYTRFNHWIIQYPNYHILIKLPGTISRSFLNIEQISFTVHLFNRPSLVKKSWNLIIFNQIIKMTKTH